MILFVRMSLNASVFDILTADDVNIVTIIVLRKYVAPFAMTL